MYPDGYSQFFTVGHNTASAKTLIVPSFPEEETYKMSFCGATSAGHLDSSTEMEYSFAINAEPTVLNGSFRMDEFLAYEENGGNETEDTASQVQNKALVNAYIHEDDIDFYSITVSHDHRYDYTSWSHNSIIHWNPATCEHTELRKNAGEHLYGSWSDYDENGDRYRACTVCGYGQKDHVHVYESEWSTSETQHWHKASCEHAGEVHALGTHVFGGWVTTDPVTGAQSRTCKTCGYVDDTGHVHVYDSEWTYDTVQHWQKATCIHSTLKRNTATHTYGFNDWEIVTEPGCVTEGEKRQKCDTCGYYRPESIPATGHAFADTWSFDDDNHWHGATCGHSDEKSDIAVHVMGDWTAPDSDGTCLRICTVCGKPETKHEHVYSSTWISDETYHWHAATCVHSSEKIDTVKHSFGSWQTVTAATCLNSGAKERVCSVCKKVETGTISATGHSYSAEWAHDETYHWHAATCEHTTVVSSKSGHKESIRSVTETTVTVVCSVCREVLRTVKKTSLDYLGMYKVLIDSELATYGITSSSIPAKINGATYVKFGVYPQTIKAASVTVDETIVNPEISGARYYLGSDGNWYSKVTEKGYSRSYTYSDGSAVGSSTKYFKVEPIIWRVLDSSKGLLLAERILSANVPYYGSSSTRSLNGKRVYDNNYKYSNVRAWLNGIDNQFVTDGGNRNSDTIDWTNKGFLQQAFTVSQQEMIKTATVDNSARSTSDAGNSLTQATGYYCEDTQDKIFLLSLQEVSTTDYGFASYSSSGTGNTRIRKPTDYALANYAYQSSTNGYGGWWWLRSPYYYFNTYAHNVTYDGNASSDYVNREGSGIVPALLVTESN